MASRGRGGKYGSGRGRSEVYRLKNTDRRKRSSVRDGNEVCACEANTPLLRELRNFEEECSRTGKHNLRCVERNIWGHGRKSLGVALHSKMSTFTRDTSHLGDVFYNKQCSLVTVRYLKFCAPTTTTLTPVQLMVARSAHLVQASPLEVILHVL